jgi:hypothetical protein
MDVRPSSNPIEAMVTTTVAVVVAMDMEGYPSTWRIPRHLLRRTFHRHHHRTWRK